MNFYYENFKESLMKGLNDFKLVQFFLFSFSFLERFLSWFSGTKIGINKTPKTE